MPRLRRFATHGGSCTRIETRKQAMAPTGMLMKKIQRQVEWSVMMPPRVGPSTGATMVAIAVMPKAAPRLAGGNVSRVMDCLFGCKAPPAETFAQTKDNELSETVRDAAQERAHREHGDADHEIALAAEHVAEPARNRQHDAVGDQIGLQRASSLFVAG